MAKGPTLGTLTKRARRMGEKRLKRLESVISTYQSEVREKTKEFKKKNIDISTVNWDDHTSTPKRVYEWAKAEKREIASAIQGTRQYSKEGKRYKTKNESYIRKQLDRLNAAIQKVAPNYRPPRDTFASTQQQINLASSKRTSASSIYTEAEVKLFYRIYEDLWHKKGVDITDRNKVILAALNAERAAEGLHPISLSEAIEGVIRANQDVLKAAEYNPKKPRTYDEVSEHAREVAERADNSDERQGSPTNIAMIEQIRDAINNFLHRPTFLPSDSEE